METGKSRHNTTTSSCLLRPQLVATQRLKCQVTEASLKGVFSLGEKIFPEKLFFTFSVVWFDQRFKIKNLGRKV